MKASGKSSRFRPSPLFDRIANAITRFTGSVYAFIFACFLIIGWAVSGPIFNFSDTWQLVINTGTTIVTFLMVFIIQQTQNKDTTALQLKLNELIACNENASNRLIDIEALTEEELLVVKKFYVRLAKLAEKENDLYGTHSLDDAERIHDFKMDVEQQRKTKEKSRTSSK
jgi:low affinity Fe/Cu permease